MPGGINSSAKASAMKMRRHSVYVVYRISEMRNMQKSEEMAE